MSNTQQPEALNLEEFRAKVAHAAREPLLARIAELEESLQFVERWAVHHGSKPSISAEEALSCIQHYPAIREITKSYEDGKHPDTFNPYARIAELEAQLSAIGAGGVEPLRKQAAAPQVVQDDVPDMVAEAIKMSEEIAYMAALTAAEAYVGADVSTKIEQAQELKKKFIAAVTALAAPPHPAEGVPAQASSLLATGLPELTEEALAEKIRSHGAYGGLAAHLISFIAQHAAPRAQADAQDVERWMGIGNAIERACADLPEETEIIVSLEKDAGTVTLIDQDGNEHENFSCDYGFAGVLNEAIDAAIAAQTKQGEQ